MPRKQDKWRWLLRTYARISRTQLNTGQLIRPQDDSLKYGLKKLVSPRLGHGTYRLGVPSDYGKCAVTREIPNGLLLRVDIHKLFDRGYVTVTPEHRFVRPRLQHEYHNGKVYYQLEGTNSGYRIRLTIGRSASTWSGIMMRCHRVKWPKLGKLSFVFVATPSTRKRAIAALPPIDDEATGESCVFPRRTIRYHRSYTC